MENDDIATQYVAAVLAQLNAEIKAAGHSEKSFAKELGISYGVFRRYLKGERPLPILVLSAAVATLGLEQTAFAARAQARFEGR